MEKKYKIDLIKLQIKTKEYFLKMNSYFKISFLIQVCVFSCIILIWFVSHMKHKECFQAEAAATLCLRLMFQRLSPQCPECPVMSQVYHLKACACKHEP